MAALNEAETIREWLKFVLELNSDLSPALWARRAGVAASTVQRALRPGYEFVTSSRTLAKLAAVVGVEPPDMRQPGNRQMVPRFLPIRYRVQAGLWYEMDNNSHFEISDQDNQHYGNFQPVAPNPKYGEWPQWLEEVVGDSADKIIPPGGLAHVVDAIEMGYAPQDGDWVVVERRRAQGSLRERTIKQIEKRGRGIKLWPRSKNPKWSEPISIQANDGGEEIEAEIVGLVIGFYLQF